MGNGINVAWFECWRSNNIDYDVCVFGRLMSQLADVNTLSTVGMWHFYDVITELTEIIVNF